MRAFLWRWRWWLVAVGLCLIAVAGAFWLQSLARDPAKMAFDRIQLGMSHNEVRAAILMEGGHRVMRKELTEERSLYAAVYWFSGLTADGRTERLYAQVDIMFDKQDRLVNKKFVRYGPSLLDKLTHWVTRIRRAVGL
jgi:hypothetical protein